MLARGAGTTPATDNQNSGSLAQTIGSRSSGWHQLTGMAGQRRLVNNVFPEIDSGSRRWAGDAQRHSTLLAPEVLDGEDTAIQPICESATTPYSDYAVLLSAGARIGQELLSCISGQLDAPLALREWAFPVAEWCGECLPTEKCGSRRVPPLACGTVGAHRRNGLVQLGSQ